VKRVLTESQGRVLRALVRALQPPTGRNDRHFTPVVVEAFESDEWSSLTFAGQRHRIALIVPGATVPALDGLDIVGLIVADIRIVAVAVVARGVALTVAVMTVDDGG
jgi:hypothetical protein